MRLSAIVLFLALGLVSCNQDNGNKPDAHQAGRDAYRAAQRAKRDMKEAEREIESAGRNFREGWNEEKGHDKDRGTRDRER